MARKRYDIGCLLCLLCLILILQSCSNDSSVDAVVLPADQTSTGCTFDGKAFPPPVTFSCQTVGPIQFHVQKSADDTTPVGDADIRIDIGNSVGDVAWLLDPTGTTCFNGDPIPNPIALPVPPGCQSQTTRTNKFGVVEFQVLTDPIASCSGTTDITSTTFAQVTISNSHATWEMPHTITCS